MQKIIVMTTIIIIALVLTGCGNGSLPSKQNGTSSQTTPQADQRSNSKDPASTTGGTSIVAKSENVMSSSDKEELLNQVDKELDSLFSNINKLEDTQDSDLDLNQK